MPTLAEWLQRIERQHPVAIDMGLDRVASVAAGMGLQRPAGKVITVAGTNGKGSTVAFIEAIARAAGLAVGAYTSPHLLAYNERVRINGAEATDDALVDAFEAVEAARLVRQDQDGRVPSLTYFEHGTLAALWLFERAGLDLAILEVGLGGRLDATNIIDPDVAIVTTVDLDHQAWLGEDRESIGREKAGIARSWKPLVIGDDDPPSSVLRHAYAVGAPAVRIGCDFFFEPPGAGATHWSWREVGCELELPLPPLAAPVQLRNAAVAIAALRALDLPLAARDIQRGVATASVPGRLQRIDQGGVEVLVDVGHNPQAAAALAEYLAKEGAGVVHAVYAALDDKDVVGVTTALAEHVDHWHLAGLAGASARGLDVETLASRLAATAAADGQRHSSVADALGAALAAASPGDRVLVFGSFFAAAAALEALR